MNKLREKRGITLIALAVTIIVILILAGIAISALTGQEGTIDQAQTIKNDTEISEEMDALRLAVQETMNSDRKGEIETTNLANHIKQHIGEDNITEPEYREDSNSHVVKFTDKYAEDDEDGYYTITEEGEILKGIVSLPVLKLDQSDIVLEFGGTFKLNATIVEDGQEDIKVTDGRWTSSDTSIAKVDEQGNITAQSKIGVTTIQVEKDGKKARCEVTVQNSVSAVYIKPEEGIEIDLSVDKYGQVEFSYDPPDANVGTDLTLSSSDSSVATVDTDGIVTGYKIRGCNNNGNLKFKRRTYSIN